MTTTHTDVDHMDPANPRPVSLNKGGSVVTGPWLPAVPPGLDDVEPAAPLGADVDRLDDRPGDAVDQEQPTGWGRFVGFVGPSVWYRSRDDRAEVEGRARRAVRATVRSIYRVGRGHLVWLRRALDATTHAAIREQIRNARAAGDADALGMWIDRLQDVKTARFERVGGMPTALRGVALVTAAGTGILAVLVPGGGLVVAVTHPLGWSWGGYWSLVDQAFHAAAVLAALAIQGAAYAAVPTWMYAAWKSGGAGHGLPDWAMAPTERDEPTAIITPFGIAESLAYLDIPPMRRALRDGWSVQFDTPPVRVNNRGYQAVFSLPMGVTASMLADKREVLARNLHRAPLEVWPADATRAGYLDLWVADAGSTTRPAREYPLLREGVADVFDGIPFGESQRGDEIAPPLTDGGNVVFGGLMGQGKSNAGRVMMLGAALDPIAELWVYVFASNGDFDAYRPRLARYVKGVEDGTTLAGRNALAELYVEVGRREARLAEVGAKKLTRALALKYPDLRPIVALFSECHELFGSEVPVDEDDPKGPKIGKESVEFATKTLRRARKTGITLAFDTQSARKDAIPPKIVELVKLNACFAVKSWRRNDGFLGDGSFQAGIRATELRAGKDVGTSLLTGATAERFEIVRWYYIAADDDTGWDAATDVIARAMEGVHPAVEVGGRAPTPTLPAAVAVDHLADISTALRGETRVRTQVVLGRLAELNASHYEDWSFYDLAEALEEHDVEVGKSNGYKVVRTEDITQALAERDRDSDDEDQGGAED